MSSTAAWFAQAQLGQLAHGPREPGRSAHDGRAMLCASPKCASLPAFARLAGHAGPNDPCVVLGHVSSSLVSLVGAVANIDASMLDCCPRVANLAQVVSYVQLWGRNQASALRAGFISLRDVPVDCIMACILGEVCVAAFLGGRFHSCPLRLHCAGSRASLAPCAGSPSLTLQP